MTIPPNPHPEQVEARELLAQKLEAFGFAGRAGCVRMGWPTDVPSHIALELAFASLANRPADDGEREALRLAYKTGHTEGYIDATDDGTGNGYCDHDAAEEGWQQYREQLDAKAVHSDATVSVNSADDLSSTSGDTDAVRPSGDAPALERKHCGLPCGFDCNHPDGCLAIPPQPEGVKRP